MPSWRPSQKAGPLAASRCACVGGGLELEEGSVKDLQGCRASGLNRRAWSPGFSKRRDRSPPPQDTHSFFAENKAARHTALSEAAHTAVSEEYQTLWQAVHAAPGAHDPEYTQPWKAEA